MFLQTLISGLAFGSLYSLAAIGLVLIYKTSNVVNFAQGEMGMFSTFVAYQLLTRWGFTYWPAVILAFSFALVLGWFVYWLILSRLTGAPLLSQIIITLGLLLLFRGAAGLIWGNVPSAFPAAVSSATFKIGPALMTENQLFTVIVTLILMLLFYALFRYTKLGLAMHSVAQNILAARLMGVSVERVYGFAWAISTGLGAVAGMFIAPALYISPTFMEGVMVNSFAAAVIGGFDSLPGAVVGGLMFGIFENLFGFYVTPAFKATFASLMIIIVLYVRPSGLFGRHEVKKL